MKLVFTQEEQMGIHCLVQCLIKADGLVHPEENVCWNTIFLKMGWTPVAQDVIANYEQSVAVATLAAMDEDKKRFATAFFTMIILADQRVAPEEAELLKKYTTEACLPEIPRADCASVLEQYLV